MAGEFQLDMIGRDGTLRTALLPMDGLADLMAFLSGWSGNPDRSLQVMTESGVAVYQRREVAAYRIEVPLC